MNILTIIQAKVFVYNPPSQSCCLFSLERLASFERVVQSLYNQCLVMDVRS
jgi:hypothetical protein